MISQRAAVRLRSSLTNCPSNPLHKLTRLSSSWSSTSPNRTAHSVSRDENGGASAVYRESRKYARPSTVTWSERLHNSVSFIGVVQYPPKRYTTKNDSFGCHTIVRANTCPDSHLSFGILIEMWHELAERAYHNLKPNDYIYVSGQLGSYTKSALEGVERLYYKVKANELNYVEDQAGLNSRGVVNSGTEVGESSVEKYRNRLHLWQVFFSNPSEWYDSRKSKKTPTYPDFKHKSTGESLWLSREDPPWVRKQLDLLDSRVTGGAGYKLKSETFPSSWVSEEKLAVLVSTKSKTNDQSYNE